MMFNPKTLGEVTKIMSSPAVKEFQKELKKNPNLIKNTIEGLKQSTIKVQAFCDTYMGVYNEKGQQIEKGDRDYFFELMKQILENQKRIEEKLNKLLEGE